MSDPHIAMQAGKTPEIFEEQVCGNRKNVKKFAGRINKFRRIGHTSAIRQRQEQQAGTTGRNERLRQKAEAKSWSKSRSKKLKPEVGVKDKSKKLKPEVGAKS